MPVKCPYRSDQRAMEGQGPDCSSFRRVDRRAGSASKVSPERRQRDTTPSGSRDAFVSVRPLLIGRPDRSRCASQKVAARES